MLRVFTEKLIDSRNSVILHRSEVISNLIPSMSGLRCGNSEATASSSSSHHHEESLRSWVSSVGHRAIDKANEKVDRAKETVRVYVGESKSEFAGNLFSKLVVNSGSGGGDVGPEFTSASNFKKEFVSIKNNLKLNQTCSLM